MANYNIQKMITSGREIMANNPHRDITAKEIISIINNASDLYIQFENAFLFGVALGVRIGKAEGGRADE